MKIDTLVPVDPSFMKGLGLDVMTLTGFTRPSPDRLDVRFSNGVPFGLHYLESEVYELLQQPGWHVLACTFEAKPDDGIEHISLVLQHVPENATLVADDSTSGVES
jgi:hypothetical protein